jgi:hypothetical protein
VKWALSHIPRAREIGIVAKRPIQNELRPAIAAVPVIKPL